MHLTEVVAEYSQLMELPVRNTSSRVILPLTDLEASVPHVNEKLQHIAKHHDVDFFVMNTWFKPHLEPIEGVEIIFDNEGYTTLFTGIYGKFAKDRVE
mgnify:CR=1 FL=1